MQVSGASDEEEEKGTSQHQWLGKHENFIELVVNLQELPMNSLEA